MDAKRESKLERKSDRELVVSRTFDAPARLVFEAWTRPELFQRWWVPKSVRAMLVSCELDVRTGGKYRLVFEHEGSTREFFGKYLEVTPPSRIVWTNEEEDGGPVSTATFEEHDGKTLLIVHERYPSKEACDAGLELGAAEGMREAFEQLDELIASHGAR